MIIMVIDYISHILLFIKGLMSCTGRMLIYLARDHRGPMFVAKHWTEKVANLDRRELFQLSCSDFHPVIYEFFNPSQILSGRFGPPGVVPQSASEARLKMWCRSRIHFQQR